MLRRLRSKPVACRRGIARSEGATSACTSSRIGRLPSIAGRSTEPGPAAPSSASADDGSTTGVEPCARHLEDPDLVGGAEAVLDRPQHPQVPVAVALELEHGVDEVLEHARAGDRPVLGHVADEDDRDAARLRKPQQPVGGLAHLRHRPRSRADVGRVQRLHRVDHAHVGKLGGDRLDDHLEVGLGQDADASAAAMRSARIRTCAGDSSPETSSVLRPRAEHEAAPGAAASSCRRPARRRSGRAIRGRARRRGRGRARRCPSPCAVPPPCPRRRGARPPRVANGRFGPSGARPPPRACSTRRTRGSGRATWARVCPQAVQTYATRVRVTDVPFWQ